MVLEIKCPYLLKDKYVEEFQNLTPSQKSNFCLEIGEDGLIHLKKTHTYYYQMLLQMWVVGVDAGVFFV